MKLYVVTADTLDHENDWGVDIKLLGVFTNEELADNYVEDSPYLCEINEIEADNLLDIYLGGYVE